MAVAANSYLFVLLQAASKPSSSLSCHLMQLNDVTVTGRDSVELARTLNDFGVLHYLQNNMSLVSVNIMFSVVVWKLTISLLLVLCLLPTALRNLPDECCGLLVEYWTYSRKFNAHLSPNVSTLLLYSNFRSNRILNRIGGYDSNSNQISNQIGGLSFAASMLNFC